MTDNNSAPSDDEVAAAQAVLARLAATNAARTAAVMPAVRTIVTDPAFDGLFRQAQEVMAALPVGSAIHSHLSAMAIGMSNLRADSQVAAALGGNSAHDEA